MVRLDKNFRLNAIDKSLSQNITDDMIMYTLPSKHASLNFIDLVICFQHMFPERGKIIPLIKLADLFAGGGSVLEPSKLIGQYSVLFEYQESIEYFKIWTRRLANQGSLLPGPEVNENTLPVYPIDYDIIERVDPQTFEEVACINGEHLADLGWLEQRCPGRWFFNNNMLFFFDRDVLMEWKLRYRDDKN